MDQPIYLDHAATSLPKPPGVLARIVQYFEDGPVSAGRGGYRRATEISQEIESVRGRLARLIHAPASSQIVFTHGGTEALNLAIQGVLQPGDRVVTTDLEHNSVLRPLAALAQSRGVQIEFVAPAADGIVDPEAVFSACAPLPRMICLTHASNVIGTIQPVSEICRWARSRGILTLVDVAQTIGHLPINVKTWECDFVAGPGHKGLRGPLGTGFLYAAPSAASELRPLLWGGTGRHSEQAAPPLDFPGGYEAGSRNVPGLLGLGAALEIVTADTVPGEALHQQELTRAFVGGLTDVPGVKLDLPAASPDIRIGVISLSIAGQDPRVVATILDQHFGIEVRSGLHCAARAHRWLGTEKAGGTVRFSFGPTTTIEEINAAVEAITSIAAAF